MNENDLHCENIIGECLWKWRSKVEQDEKVRQAKDAHEEMERQKLLKLLLGEMATFFSTDVWQFVLFPHAAVESWDEQSLHLVWVFFGFAPINIHYEKYAKRVRLVVYRTSDEILLREQEFVEEAKAKMGAIFERAANFYDERNSQVTRKFRSVEKDLKKLAGMMSEIEPDIHRWAHELVPDFLAAVARIKNSELETSLAYTTYHRDYDAWSEQFNVVLEQNQVALAAIQSRYNMPYSLFIVTVCLPCCEDNVDRYGRYRVLNSTPDDDGWFAVVCEDGRVTMTRLSRVVSVEVEELFRFPADGNFSLPLDVAEAGGSFLYVAPQRFRELDDIRAELADALTPLPVPPVLADYGLEDDDGTPPF